MIDLKLLGGLDGDVPGLPSSAGAAAEHRQTALRLMNSEATRIAFDPTRESPRLRERYGLHAWGQRCLARRLVEAGASFVDTMVLENPYQSGIPYSQRRHLQLGTATPSTATSSTTRNSDYRSSTCARNGSD
ncbi:MAG UNVERIFIED_CONTAM: hypothetical protein LVQ98_05470 [Rickettsiaceae bacterium]|jgi:hypothetical protein